MHTSFSNMDGEVQNLEVLTGMSDLKSNLNDFPKGDDFYYATGRGKRLKDTAKKAFSYTPIGMVKTAIDRAPQRQQARQERRQARQERKMTEAQANLELAKSVGASAPVVPTAPAPAAPVSTGLSTGAKVGIGVAIAAVLGVVIYMVAKGRGKGK
mgnify:CR=1 FL=1